MFANALGPRGATFLALWLAFTGSANAANRRIFSYDPADTATREAAGQLTFEFNQKLFSTTVLRVRSTEESATADLKPAPQEAVGRGGVSRFVGPQAGERDLYQILPADDGPAMISAFCPGARRAWMAFGRLRANQDLRVYVIGDYPGGGAKLCRSLRFTYHGEWRLPPGPLMNPDTLPVDRRPF
jgi:hypothetical protein